MRKKLIILFMVLVLSLSLFSCSKDKLTDFQSLVQIIYKSEEIIAGYDEDNLIYDGDFEVYNKNTNFKIQRGEKVKSEVSITEKKLSTSGEETYDEILTEYSTVDDVKYTVVNGTVYENSYTVPTYYLTFVLSEDFFEDYTLNRENENYKLSGKVYDNKISSLFLNKSLNNITNLNVEINVENGLLKSFNATYESTNGFNATLNTSYIYASKGYAKAVFYLEGGVCQNSKDRVSYLYSFDGTMTETKIVDPNLLETEEKDMITKNNYHIEGWYRTKTENPDGTVTYSDKWDFDKDKMTFDGVVLYAKWEINRVYTYELYYKDKDGKDVFLDKYQVEEGEKFYEKSMKNRTVEGYTSLGYLDEAGNPWNENFTHPGGDSDVAVKLYLDLIEGEYTVVKTLTQFSSAIKKNKNVYLLNDIDCKGKAISYDGYTGIIDGNGHKIYNFEVYYDSSKYGLKGPLDDLEGSIDHLYISLFFELKDAVIKNITFDEMIIDVNTSFSLVKYIIVSPLAITASNCTLENVKINGNIKYTKLPDAEVEVVLDNYWYQELENVVDAESSLVITGGASAENN